MKDIIKIIVCILLISFFVNNIIDLYIYWKNFWILLGCLLVVYRMSHINKYNNLLKDDQIIILKNYYLKVYKFVYQKNVEIIKWYEDIIKQEIDKKKFQCEKV